MKNKNLIETLQNLYCLYSDFEKDIPQIKDAILKDFLTVDIKKCTVEEYLKNPDKYYHNEDLPF